MVRVTQNKLKLAYIPIYDYNMLELYKVFGNNME